MNPRATFGRTLVGLAVIFALAGGFPRSFARAGEARSAAVDAWTGYLRGRPNLFPSLKIETNPYGLAALGRLVVRTNLSIGDLSLHGPGDQAAAISAALDPLMRGALAETREINFREPPSEMSPRLRELSSTLTDLHAVLDILPENDGSREAVLLGHHLVEARLRQAGEARAADAVQGAKKAWQERESGSPAAEPIRELYERFDAVTNGRIGALDKLNRPAILQRRGKVNLPDVLFAQRDVVASLEQAGAGRVHEHIFGLIGEASPGALFDWLGLIRHLGWQKSDILGEPANWNLMLGAARGFVQARDIGQNLLWRGILDMDRDFTRYILFRPDPAHLKYLILHERIGEGARSAARWSLEERLVYEAMKAENDRDHLRGALNLLHARLGDPKSSGRRRIPDALWEAMLRRPPENKEERAALQAAATLLNMIPNIEVLQEVLMRRVPTDASGKVDYVGLDADLVEFLLKDLPTRLKLSDKARDRMLRDPEFVQALGADGLLRNILTLSSFSTWKGRSSLRLLLKDLADSPVQDGRIQYRIRYDALHGALPEDVLDRWTRNYDQEEMGAGAEPLREIDWNARFQELAGTLNVGTARDVRNLSDKVRNLARGLGQELPSSQEDNRKLLAVLQNEFLGNLEAVLEALEENRAPPSAKVKALVPLLGKRNWMKGMIADPAAALAAVKGILADLGPQPRKAAAPAGEMLHVTDDPAMMIQMGNFPIPTCQRCTEPTLMNENGEPVNRLLLGQIKLGYWTKGGRLLARSVLEIGQDDRKRPALFVERAYFDANAAKNTDALEPSILEYARRLGVARVYFAAKESWDVPLLTGQGWGIADRSERHYFLRFGEKGLKVYRDSFWGNIQPAVTLENTDKVPPISGTRLLRHRLLDWWTRLRERASIFFNAVRFLRG